MIGHDRPRSARLYRQRAASRHARGAGALCAFAALAACVGEPDLGLGEAEREVTTTSLLPSASLARGASRSGTYASSVAATLTFRTAGSGDADLYVRRGSGATASAFDCKSDGGSAAERCALTVAQGELVSYYVLAYAAAVVSLDVDVEARAAAPTSAIELVPSAALAQGQRVAGELTATAAGPMVFRSAGTGDVDLYVRRGAAATTELADCKAESASAVETCTVDALAGERLHYLLYAYAASTASLTVTAPGAGTPDYRSALSLPSLPTAAAHTALSIAGGVMSTSGRSLKFLIDNRTPTARVTRFINGNYQVAGTTPAYARYHYDFAKRELGLTDSVATFNQSTYFGATKRFFAGTLQTYVRGSDSAPTYAVQFYPDDEIAEERLLEALTTLRPLIAIPGAKLMFVATGPQQTFARIGAAAAALGFELRTIDQVLGDLRFLGLNPGEAWGYLRIFPSDPSTLRPTDIPVFDELPLDLSVVAGVITRAYQDVNSHVNLKSKERGTPNLVLRDAGANDPRLAPWAGRPVHLVVTSEGFILEATTDAIIAAKLAERQARPWIALPVVDESRLLTFDELCPRLSAGCFDAGDRVGGKATGLGFLASPQAVGRAATAGTLSARFGYDLSPRGFSIPVQAYRDFVAAPENAALKAAIDAFVVEEKRGALSPAERNARVLAIQGMFYRGRMAPATLAAITERLTTLMPGVPKFKLRSSATSEDIQNFNGAGLYDSFSAELDKVDNPDLSCALNPELKDGVVVNLKMKPKTVQCAIKGVYASLWNSRAIDERSFARLDHATAGMGIAVNPSYDTEDEVVANAVVVTRVLGSDVLGYSLSVQQGNNLVTNPLPGTISEFDIAAFSDATRPTRFTTTRYATPTAGAPALTSTVLSAAQQNDIVEIARRVEQAYCAARPTYYPGGTCSAVHLDSGKPRALDMELKILANGHYVLKQVREFTGR